MPLDKRNLTMSKAMGLAFSPFDVASAQQVPIDISQYIQCMLHGLTCVFAESARCQFAVAPHYHFPRFVTEIV